MLTLDNIKSLYIKGMNYANSNYKGILFDRMDNLSNYQLELANKATDLTTLMNAIWIGNVNKVWSSAFNGPKPICTGCELGYTAVQFGTAHVGWYFFYGIAGSLCFNLSFFRLEIAPESVVEEEYPNLPKGEAVRWSVLGGFGTIPSEPGSSPGEWYSIQPEWIYMKYDQPSYSTFSLVGSGNNIQVSLSSPTPMNFQIDMKYTDTNNKPHSFSTVMVANTGPTANMPNSCECGFGLGSFYYSYTDMTVNITADDVTGTGGSGWVDHQLIKNGVANTLYGQALQTLSNILTKNVTPGWLWTTIQDKQSGIQYMFTHFFGKKFYASDVVANQNITNSMINVYKQGVPYFNPTSSDMDSRDMKMVMTKTVYSSTNGLHMPASYNITLPGGKQVILSIATAPNVYPSSFAPYETPAFLYDLNGNIIGTGLIEANFYFDNQTMASRLIDFAGGNSKNSNEFNIVYGAITQPQKWYQKLLAFIIVFGPLLIILFSVWFVLKNKENRKNKFFLVLAILLILYWMLN